MSTLDTCLYCRDTGMSNEQCQHWTRVFTVGIQAGAMSNVRTVKPKSQSSVKVIEQWQQWPLSDPSTR